ncbi:hypothetical protein HMPREF1544_01103 [Mucor circinelloides 1006PhL]|uniref:Uncharacterized protein n=1 Tax=Mucor circinelloides f. circinelloides (strain 1006PhL) TaxID=1220926 RepID=S2JPZ9_MUCC1|nr:hypothetical protein HMPREF1544_01103 [Mucor circinelloides 1006PhL]
MKFADKNPPINENIWEPDIENSFYYLSFLERYIEETKTIPPDLRKVYLVRAEYRYIKWLNKYADLTPPTDIAFTWHAHLLSPRRYFEDKARSTLCGLANYGLNLKRWHQSYSTAENKVKVDWKRYMGNEPYRLAPDNLLNAPFPTIKCIVCRDIITLEWMDYTTWRTNPTTAVQCSRCDAMFTIKHVGKSNLITDLTKSQLQSVVAMAGLMFTHTQGDTNTNPQPDAAFFVQAFAHKFKSLPFNSGINAIEHLLYDKEEDGSNGAELCADVMDAIRSTYMCSPYRESSVDLLQAVSRLYKFAFRVIENMEWDIPTDIYKCFFHMREFFGILKENKHAIPSIYAGKHAPIYSSLLDIHKAFNHDELIPLNQVQYYAERTRHKWKLYKSAKTQYKFDKKNGSSSSMFQSVFSWKKNVQDYVTTISGENSEYLNRWVRTKTTPKGQTISAEDPDYVTYSKVSRNVVSALVVLFNSIDIESGSQKIRPNSTEEPWFHWQKASIAWVYAKNKQEVENSIRRSMEAAKAKETPGPIKGYFIIYNSKDYIPVGEGF